MDVRNLGREQTELHARGWSAPITKFAPVSPDTSCVAPLGETAGSVSATGDLTGDVGHGPLPSSVPACNYNGNMTNI